MEVQEKNQATSNQIQNDLDVVPKYQHSGYIPTQAELLEEDKAEKKISSLESKSPSPSTKFSKVKIAVLFFIIAAVAIAIGVSLKYCLNKENDKKEKNSLQSNDSKFKEYEQVIMAGQENNVVKMVYIPKNQKIYEYTIESNSTIAMGEGKEQKTNSKQVHTIGLLCLDVNDEGFEIYMYFKNTNSYQNGNLISSFIGFPDEQNSNNKPSNRFLDEPSKDSIENQDQTKDKNENPSIEEITNNDYSPLSEEEINILSKNNISLAKFYTSTHPIIRFKISKDGHIKNIILPVALKYDLQKIYLNVIEQIFPILKQEYYGGDQKFKQQTFNSEEVEPILEATIGSNFNVTLSKSYKTFDEANNRETSYRQKQKIENGVLKEVMTESNFSVVGKEKNQINPEENQKDEKVQASSKIEVFSLTLLQLQSQEEDVPDSFMNLIENTYSSMTALNFTHAQAQEFYINVFGSTSNKVKENSEENGGRRDLQSSNNKFRTIGQMNVPIETWGVFSKDNTISFYQNCQYSITNENLDECEFKFITQQNQYSKTEVILKKFKFDVSKNQKNYQYLQFLTNELVNKLKPLVNQDFVQFNEELSNLQMYMEQTFRINNSEILSSLIDDLSFSVLKNAREIEIRLNMVPFKIQTYFSISYNELSETILSYLTQKEQSLNLQAKLFNNNIIKYLKNIKDILDQEKTIEKNQLDEITSYIQNISNIIKFLFQTPINDHLNQLEQSITENTSRIYTDFVLSISSQITYYKKQYPNMSEDKLQTLKLVTQGGFYQQISQFLQQQLKMIESIKDKLYSQIDDISKNIKVVTDDILKQLQTIDQNSNKQSDAIQFQLEALNSIYETYDDVDFGQEGFINEIEIQFISQIYLHSLIAVNFFEDLVKYIDIIPKTVKEAGIDTLRYSSITEQKLNNQDKLINKIMAQTKKGIENMLNTMNVLDQPIQYPVKHSCYNNDKSIFENIQGIAETVYEPLYNLEKKRIQFEEFIKQLKTQQPPSPSLNDQLFSKVLDNMTLYIHGMQQDPNSIWRMMSKDQSTTSTIQSQTIVNKFSDSFKTFFSDLKQKLTQKVNNNYNEWYSKNTIQSNMNLFIGKYNLILERDVKYSLFQDFVETKQEINTYHPVKNITPIGMNINLQLELNWRVTQQNKLSINDGFFQLSITFEVEVTRSGLVDTNMFNIRYIIQDGGKMLDAKLSTIQNYAFQHQKRQTRKGDLTLSIKKDESCVQHIQTAVITTEKKSDLICKSDFPEQKFHTDYKIIIQAYQKGWLAFTNPKALMQCYYIITTTTTPIKLINTRNCYTGRSGIYYQNTY